MSAPFDGNTYRCLIVRHVDADTTHVTVLPGFDVSLAMTIRWFGIDAPEIGTPEGKAAMAWVEARMPVGATVLFQSSKGKKEKYGRYLGTFIVEGVNVNEDMIAAGHAVFYDGGTR